MKAREWLERGKAANSPIDAARDFWAGFNNLYASQKKADERTKFSVFLAEAVSAKMAESILSSTSAEVAYLLSQPVVDMPWEQKDTSQYISAYHADPDARKRLINIFLIIYQVRCNLEHGQKSPSRARDVQLCSSAAPIIAQVIEQCA